MSFFCISKAWRTAFLAFTRLAGVFNATRAEKAVPSRVALSDLTLNFLADKGGRKRATLGGALGTVGRYAGISVFVLVLLSGYLRDGG